MRRTGKEIYRRFWIWNRIFSSIYGSGHIARSLDTTFTIFGQNLNFVDEYLENKNFFGHAVFARCSISISSTFWPNCSKILRAVSEEKLKNSHFDHIFVLFGWSKIFLDNPALSLFSVYQCLTSCQVSRRSLEPFSRKSVFRQTDRQTFRLTGSTKVENCSVD